MNTSTQRTLHGEPGTLHRVRAGMLIGMLPAPVPLAAGATTIHGSTGPGTDWKMRKLNGLSMSSSIALDT